jgi:hypothetical protein
MQQRIIEANACRRDYNGFRTSSFDNFIAIFCCKVNEEMIDCGTTVWYVHLEQRGIDLLFNDADS